MMTNEQIENFDFENISENFKSKAILKKPYFDNKIILSSKINTENPNLVQFIESEEYKLKYKSKINHMKNQVENMVSTIDLSMFDFEFDSSISIGLCSDYTCSFSQKFSCPFDNRTNSIDYNEFYLELEKELEYDEYTNLLRCQGLCKLRASSLYYKNGEVIQKELYKVLAKTLKNNFKPLKF